MDPLLAKPRAMPWLISKYYFLGLPHAAKSFWVDVNRLCVLFWLERGFKSFGLLKTKTSICLCGLSFVFYVFVANLCMEITSFVF